ncbi:MULTISPECIES: MATE family efflux transporter [Anaerococcus]|uniref:Multidrug export protein MepA n=1 Tax=Anaerococcus octavius TaxID=54007 RepID=A0A2I1M6M8_9FIRM|nr:MULTISPECIES: MATE family efflux transporter [Anaerococcus]MBS6106089.1 MATE family efflux transporter [Anaerococcus sp.]PKZ15764.1 MATE family efflux transporter [Anaerococcus octavius]
MKEKEDKLLKEKPFKLMLELSVPAIIGMVIIGLYPLMDGIFAGQILGNQAMTAVGIAMPMTFINSGISTLIGVGSASILSRAIGRKDQQTIDKIMNNLLFWVVLLSAIVTVLGLVFTDQLLSIMGATPDIQALAVRYMKIIFIGSFFVNFTQASNMVIRGEGLMKDAMIIMGTGALINIILDPILMKAMGDKGIEGAAIATVTAQILQAIMTIFHFKKKSKIVKITGIKADRTLYKEMFAIGVSAMLMQVLSIIQQTLLYNSAFANGGESAGSIMAASLRVFSFSFIPLWGMSQGLQPAIGANIGAKNYDRVKRVFKVFSLSSVVLAALFWIPSLIFSEKLLGLFGIEGQTLIQGIPSFRIFYSVYITYGIMIMCITFFQAIGDGKSAGLLVMLRQIILFVPAIFILPKLLGLTGVWLAEPITDFIVFVLGVWRYKKTVAKLQQE